MLLTRATKIPSSAPQSRLALEVSTPTPTSDCRCRVLVGYDPVEQSPAMDDDWCDIGTEIDNENHGNERAVKNYRVKYEMAKSSNKVRTLVGARAQLLQQVRIQIV
jgi:hypothetical protein